MSTIIERAYGHYFIKSLFIFIVYCASEKLPLLLLITNEFSLPVWPPAGIGLACILLWKYRYLPSIIMGAMALNLSAIIQHDILSFTTTSTLTAMATGANAALQAVIGAALIRRFIGTATQLVNINQILIVFILGGAVACLTSSTLSSLILIIANFISSDSFFESALTWWISDLMGIVLFTPIVLLLNSSNSKLRKLVVTIPILVFFFISTFTFYSIKNSVNTEEKKEFNFFARNIVNDF